MELKGTYKEPFDKKLRGDLLGDKEPPRTQPHRGQDWKAKANSVIPAISDGKIAKIFWSDALGWVVRQKTALDDLYVDYCHLVEEPKSIKAGDAVKLGQPVGRVGNTGTSSFGAHLHMAVSKKESVNTCAYKDLIDPLALFKAKAEAPKAEAKPAEKPVKVAKKTNKESI